jgi:hypothetical protein
MDIKWISTGLLVTGATALALQLPYYKFCFPMFICAHIILAYQFGVKHKNLPLFIQNCYFIGLNSIGTYVWLV